MHLTIVWFLFCNHLIFSDIFFINGFSLFIYFLGARAGHFRLRCAPVFFGDKRGIAKKELPFMSLAQVFRYLKFLFSEQIST